MRGRQMNRSGLRAFSFSWFWAAVLVLAGPALAGDDFRSASSVDTVREQVSRLPKDDIWWSVNGDDMRWNNKNLQRVMPTVTLYREGQVRMLESAPNPAIPAFLVDTPAGPVDFLNFLDSDYSTTMGVVILHKGKVVFEHYPRMEPYEKPIYWSVTKVFVSTLVAILEDRGQIDVAKPIEHYLRRLKGSPYEGVTVRNILDMASGVHCPDEYEDRDSCYYRFASSIGDAYFTATSPDDPYEFFAELQGTYYAEQGTQFQYSGANTFILGWLVEEITGMPFQDALTREIWRKTGMEGDGAMMAPRFGVPVMDGGLMARLRDVARFGLLFTPSYSVVSDEKIIPDSFMTRIFDDGNAQLFARARAAGHVADEVLHPYYQWDQVYRNGDIYKGGWAGQGLLINAGRDTVAVYTGYFKKDQSELSLLPRLRSVLNGLYGSPD